MDSGEYKKALEFVEKSGPVFFVSPSINRGIGLEDTINDFYIIYSQKSDLSEMIKENGEKCFFINDQNLKDSGRILRNEKVLKYIKDKSDGRVPGIITFKPSPMISKICEKEGFRYLGNDWNINRKWEDKIFFSEATNELNIRNANSQVYLCDSGFPYDKFYFNDGKKYVMQFSRGYSGNSSFLVKSEEEMKAIVSSHLGRRIRVSDYIVGDSYTLNVCLGDFGILISSPIFQITGFSDFNKNILGTCGNDYSYYKKNLSEKAIKEINIGIKKISNKLKDEGYKGIVGFDFVVKDDDAHMIEINPRLIGSIPVFTKLQKSLLKWPFLLLHILSFLDFDFNSIKVEEPFFDAEFSQIIMRNVSGENLKVEKTLPSGIYEIKEENINLLERRYFAEYPIMENMFFVQSIGEGEYISSDMEYANLQFGYGIMENRDKFINDFEIVKRAVLKNIILK